MTEASNPRPGLIVLLIAVVVIFILVAVILLFPPGGNGDDGENGGGGEGPWKDLTRMKASISEVTVFNYNEIDGPTSLDERTDVTDTVYMLIGLQENLTSEDIVSMRDFAERGGKVIVADDGTRANRISNFFQGESDGKVEYTGKNYLVDSLFTEGPNSDPGWVHNVRFIKGYSIVQGTQPHDVLVDRPKGLIITGEGRPVLTTTKELTVIDMNENGEMDLEEGNEDIYQAYGPVAAEFDVGENGGTITYFSSTGIFTDSMFSEAENEEFLREYLLSLIPDGGRILLDDSKQTGEYSPHTAVIPG